MGVVVVEVIDITIDEIANAQYNRWDFKNGSSQEIMFTAEDNLYELKGLYQSNRNLRGIKESSAVILPEIKENQWLDQNFDNKNIIFQDQMIPKKFLNRIEEIDTLAGDEKLNSGAWNDILMILTGQITHSVKSSSNINSSNKNQSNKLKKRS